MNNSPYDKGFGSFEGPVSLPRAIVVKCKPQAKISAKLREETAAYCSMTASWFTSNSPERPPAYYCMPDAVAFGDLAMAAAVFRLYPQYLDGVIPGMDIVGFEAWTDMHAKVAAEAEAMIRTGWRLI